MIGPNARLVGSREKLMMIEKWAKQGMDIFVINVLDFIVIQLYICENITIQKIIEMIDNHVKTVRSSDIFVKHIKSCIAML